jgi:microcystin-dependent protein
MVGLDAGDSSFDTAEETGGSKDAVVVSHTHTATSTVTDPGHLHTYQQDAIGNTLVGQDTSGNFTRNTVNTSSAVTGISVSTSISSTGSSGTNANLQPYITVYMWKRTA